MLDVALLACSALQRLAYRSTVLKIEADDCVAERLDDLGHLKVEMKLWYLLRSGATEILMYNNRQIVD